MSGPWSNPKPPPRKSPAPGPRPIVTPEADVYRRAPITLAVGHSIVGLIGAFTVMAFGLPVAAGMCMILAMTAMGAGRALRHTAAFADNPRAAKNTGAALIAGGFLLFPLAGLMPRETAPPSRFTQNEPRLKAAADAAFGCTTTMTVERAADSSPSSVTLRCTPPTPTSPPAA